jgi:hypothetical protein
MANEITDALIFEPLPTVDILKEKIIKYNITKYAIDECSFCHCANGYIFSISNGEVIVKYDKSCNCLHVKPIIRQLEDIVEYMSLQSEMDVINKIKQFWHLD